MSEAKNESLICSYCQRSFSSLLEFTKCHHKICTSCMFQRIFINHIQDFTGVSMIKVTCKCGLGELDQTLNDVSSIIMKKIKLDEKKESNNINEEMKLCKQHPSFYLNHYCMECSNYVCKKCKAEKTNEHHTHRVLTCKKLRRTIKNNIDISLILKFNNDSFKIICENASEQIQKEVQMFNKTLGQIDNLITNICDFRDKYIQKYKEELKNLVQNFKIIKIYYMNYYNDLKIAKENKEKCDDINFLRYINNISYEFEDLKIEHFDILSKKISEFSSFLEKTKSGSQKIFNAQFYFTEGKREYMLENYINKAHDSFISSLVELSNDRILTASRQDYLMKIFQENEEGTEYKEVNSIKGTCGCVLYYKEKKRIISGGKDGVISIFEEKKSKEFKKIMTLSGHQNQKPINSMAKISDDKFVSGGSDCLLIIWKTNEEDDYGQYNKMQTIKMHNIITNVIALFDSRIVFTCNEGIIYIYKIDPSFEKGQKDITTYIEDQILKDKHKGIVGCLCQLDNGYIVSGGNDKVEGKKTIKDRNIVIWRNEDNYYFYHETLKGHIGNITCIIQLRDTNFASSSVDHTIKIWKGKKEEKDKTFNYEMAYDIRDFSHGIYKLIQLEDDRLCGTSSTNQIVFWRNRAGSYK